MPPQPHLPASSTDDRHERGASLVEYVLLVSLIALTAVAAVSFFGGNVDDSYDRTVTAVQEA